jgi:hypothetical protein
MSRSAQAVGENKVALIPSSGVVLATNFVRPYKQV